MSEKCSACGMTHAKRSLNMPGPTLTAWQHASEEDLETLDVLRKHVDDIILQADCEEENEG